MFETRNNKRGYLMLIGGAEDKSRDKTVLKKVIKTARAKNVVVIPSASSYPRDIINNYYDAFKSLGVKEVEGFDIRYPDEADRNEFLEKIEKADLIFFGGGDQKRLVEVFRGSRLLERIWDRFNQGTLHIAGTSAGAAAASNPMTYDGDYNGFAKGSVNYSEGFGFLEGITIDTHFLSRERIPRLTQFLLTGKSFKGIGIDEDTGIIISPSLRFEVVGSGLATVINTEKITYSDYQEIRERDIYSANNVRIGFLAAGTKFSIKRWTVLKNYGKNKVLEKSYTWN